MVDLGIKNNNSRQSFRRIRLKVIGESIDTLQLYTQKSRNQQAHTRACRLLLTRANSGLVRACTPPSASATKNWRTPKVLFIWKCWENIYGCFKYHASIFEPKAPLDSAKQQSLFEKLCAIPPWNRYCCIAMKYGRSLIKIPFVWLRLTLSAGAALHIFGGTNASTAQPSVWRDQLLVRKDHIAKPALMAVTYWECLPYVCCFIYHLRTLGVTGRKSVKAKQLVDTNEGKTQMECLSRVGQ